MNPTRIVDSWGRQFKSLRVSLTPFCNLRCVYCVGLEDTEYRPQGKHKSVLFYKDHRWVQPKAIFQDVKLLHEWCSFQKVRITGGEPTLYPHLVEFVELLASLHIKDIAMTSNGVKLRHLVSALAKAGLQRINISLDTLDEATFLKLNRGRKLPEVLSAIEASLQAGLKVRLNCTPIRGYNDGHLVELMEYARARNIPIRFIELMKMGPLYQQHQKYFVPMEEMLQQIKQKWDVAPLTRKASATAQYWKSTLGHQFGFISNHSAPFCADCDRLRLDSQGHIRGCITSHKTFNIRQAKSAQELQQLLASALQTKNQAFVGSKQNSMKALGG